MMPIGSKLRFTDFLPAQNTKIVSQHLLLPDKDIGFITCNEELQNRKAPLAVTFA
jgi:hypothetical protein